MKQIELNLPEWVFWDAHSHEEGTYWEIGQSSSMYARLPFLRCLIGILT